MNRPGKMTDNAFIESFFHSMKAEIYHGVRFEEDASIRDALKSYVPFYNTDRLHSSLHYVSPATFEQQARGPGVNEIRGTSRLQLASLRIRRGKTRTLDFCIWGRW
jgi:transposase InsO family protein